LKSKNLEAGVPHEVIGPLIHFAGAGAFFGFLLAIAVSRLERSLTFGQAFRISAIASVVALVAIFLYHQAIAELGISVSIPPWPWVQDVMVKLAAMCLAGAIVTRLSKNYGIKKEGWFGVGGRAIGWIYALLLMLGAIVIALRAL
jgi:hypothetical protein